MKKLLFAFVLLYFTIAPAQAVDLSGQTVTVQGIVRNIHPDWILLDTGRVSAKVPRRWADKPRVPALTTVSLPEPEYQKLRWTPSVK